MDFVSVASAGNTVANITSFDDYTVTATNAATLGTKEAVAEENMISVYPNPATEFLNIQSEAPVTQVEVTNMAGRKMQVQLDHNKIDIRNLTPGIYTVSIEIKGNKFSKKIIKK
jgi:hypothetical protein